MIRKILHSKKGEGYVDMCVGVVVFVMILVIAINIFSFITLRIEMDQIADELIEAATYAGCFDDDFWHADSDMLDQYYYYGIDYGADRYFNSTYRRVQLGERMWVEISKHTYAVYQLFFFFLLQYFSLSFVPTNSNLSFS